MKKYADTISTIAITFIVSLILNSALNFFIQDSGKVSFSEPINIHNQEYIQIDLEIYGNKAPENLIFAVPTSTVITDIVSSLPLSIVELPAVIGVNQIKHIRVSGIEPNTGTQLMIPISNQAQADIIRLVNSKELNFSTTFKNAVQSPTDSAARDGLRSSLINIFIFSIAIYWSFLLNENSKKEVAEFRKEVEEYKEKAINQSLEFVDRIQKNKQQYQKNNLLLLARISDYEKELTFWRDTIRKILYENGQNEKAVETIQKQITQTLQTYSIQGREVDFDAVKTMALLMNSAESQNNFSDQNKLPKSD